MIQVPTCTFSASPAHVAQGQPVTLAWTTSEGATFASINNGVGGVGIDGMHTAYPSQSTTYTLHVWNSQGEGSHCSAPVSVSGTAPITGSTGTPHVTLQQLALHPAGSQVTLSNLPYTGAGNVFIGLFASVIALSALYAWAQRRAVFA